MKRKWLIGLLSILMVLAMCFGIVACGDSNTEGNENGNNTEQGGGNENEGGQGGDTQSDEQIADAAIASLRTLYKDGETASAYKVLGQTKVNGETYAIKWTVTSDVTNITDYVKIGAMDESTKQITIDIVQGETEITYKLTASVTVGEVTKTLDVNKTIPAAGKIYTPSEALALGKTLTHASGSNETYYAENGTITAITVKGYVVAIDTQKGGWSDEYKNLNRVYIGDTAETTQADALYVYRIVSDEVYLTGADSIEVGDLVTLNGALEKYYETVELTYCNQVTPSINVTVLGIEKAGEKTDEQVLAAAQTALKLSVNYFSATGDYDLPADVDGVSVTWELDGGNNANVKVENGKLTVLNVPDPEASYTLKATLSYGSAAPVTKEFPIKVGKLTLTHAGTQADPYTPAEAIAIAATVADGEYYSDENGVKGVYVKGKVVDVGSWSGGNFNNYNKIYLIASEDYRREATKDTAGAILVYRIANDSRLTEGCIHHGDELLLLCGIQNYGGTPELGTTQGASDKVNATTLVEYNPVELGPQDKVDDALKAVNATYDVTTDGEYTLPTPTIDGVTFTWATDTKLPEGITFDVNKINVAALPENDVPIVFTLTATCGTEGTGSKTVTVTVKKQGSAPQPGDGLLLTTETLFAGLSKQNSYAVFDGTHTVGSTTVTTDKVMISTSNDYPDTLQFQKSNGTITLSGTFTKIVIVVDTSFDLVNPTVTVGTTSITGTADAGVDHGKTSTDYTIKRYTIEYNIDVAGEQTVTIKTANSSGAMYVPSITLTGTAGSGSQGGGDEGGGGAETPTGTFTPLTEAKTGTFKFALYYGTDKSYYYATGNMVNTYYYETTTDVSQAADFVITSVGDNQYTITINGKYLEVVPRTNGSQGVNIAMNTTRTEGKYWQWIDGIQNFVMESTYNKTDDESATDLYYFGNYNTNTSMNVNYIGRIATGSDGSYTPNNLEGVSQWVAHFGTLENGSTEPEPENQADQKIAAAKAAILAGQIDLETEYSTTNGEGVDLPAENNGATLAWAVKNAQDVIAQVKIEGNKLIIIALPQDVDLKVTLVATISCDGATKTDTAEVEITIKKAASTGPVDPSQGKTATFTASEYATQNSWVEYTSYPEITLDENIKASLSTGTNNGKYNYGGWGMYGSEDAVLTITAENGATIVSVKIVYEAKKNGVVCDSEKQTQYPTGSTIPVNASSLTLKITNTDTATNGQAFFTSIEVVYTLGGSTTPGGGDPGTTTPTDGEIVLDFSQALSTFTGSGAGKWNDPYTYGAQSNQLSEINANAPAGTISYSRICAMKVSDGNLIQDRPVLAPNGKQGDANNTVYVTLQLTDKNFSSVSFELKGWSDSKKFDDIHIEYSNDGSEWTACSEKWPAEGTTEDKVSTDGQTFTATSIPANMKYVRLAVSVKETTSTSNKNTQVGLTSVTFKVTD